MSDKKALAKLAQGSQEEIRSFVPSPDPADELRNVLEPVLSMSLLTRDNVLVVSPVGMGKTEILFYAAKQVFDGSGAIKVISCTPDTAASQIAGYENPLYMIDPEGAKAKGQPRWVVEGSAVDPSVQVFIADEVQRLESHATDALVGIMHDIQAEWGNRPITWATTNWTMTNTRTEAVRDRVGMTVFYQPGDVDVRAVMTKNPISEWAFNIPDTATIAEVRAMLKQPVPAVTFETIAEALTEIGRLVKGTEFHINNRRVRQWQRLLYASGFYAYGKTEFSRIPASGIQILSHAYPVVSANEALEWRRIVSHIADVVESAIAEFLSNAYQQWQEVVKDSGAKLTPAKREELSITLGTLLAQAQEELENRWPADPRAKRAIGTMNDWWRAARRGENF